MNKSYKYKLILLAVVTAALFAGCSQDKPEVLTSDQIRINAVGRDVVTKGFLNSADLPVEGTTVKVYDDLTGFTGKIDGTSYTGTQEVPYINDALVYGSDGWSFDSGIAWRWTRTGVHHFYGWLTKDAKGDSENNPLTPASLVSGYVPTLNSNKEVSVPSITFTKDTPQFDFSYSDKVAVDVEDEAFVPGNTVKLPMNHLFSALAVSIQNGGNDVAHINAVSISGLKNKKSATIDFSGSETGVTMVAEGETAFLSNWSGTLSHDNKIDLVSGTPLSMSAKAHSYLMWPQTPEEVFAMNITVVYSLEGVYSTEPGHEDELALFTKTLPLKDTGYFGTEDNKKGIDAGKKYYLNLQFKAKAIDLMLVVMPWDYTEFDLDFSSSSISANNANGIPNEGVMWLETLTYDTTGNEVWTYGSRETREVTLASDRRIRGTFYIGSPHSGSWQITTYTTPSGYEDRFRVEPSTGDIDDDLIRNHQGKVTFFVYPNGPVDVQVKLHFNLAFRFNGESQWRDGNSEFNRKDWKVVREP